MNLLKLKLIYKVEENDFNEKATLAMTLKRRSTYHVTCIITETGGPKGR